LTVIKKTSSLANYPFKALAPEVVELLERTAKRVSSTAGHSTALKLLECYCDLHNAQVTYLDLSSSKYLDLVKGLMGAVMSDDFVEMHSSTRRAVARQMAVIHQSLCNEIPAMERVEHDPASMALCDAIWQEHRSELCPVRVQYWNGWIVESSKGQDFYLAVQPIWTSHGQEFAEDFFLQWKLHFKKQARPAYALVNKMVGFLSANCEDWPAVTFQHPQMVKGFFLAFMKDFFLDVYKRGLNIDSQIVTWVNFMVTCEQIFIETGKWATPYQGGLPKPKVNHNIGHASRKKMGDDGVVVHEKLITPIPLHLTDEEAIEIIFSRILTDISIIKSWAFAQRSKIINSVYQRKELAKTGTPINSGMSRKTIAEIGPENICATFERDGYQRDVDYVLSHFGHESFKKIAELLGLPIAYSLHPYQFLLVSEHPEITPSFLYKLQLQDDNGDYIGYIKSDGGAKLIGYKDRRGKGHSEQIIELTVDSQRWIEEIIEITAPLRDALRKEGNPIWKELFITCGKGFGPPSSPKLPIWNRSTFESKAPLRESLIEQFAPYENMMPCGTLAYLERVSLSSLRSSCGVEVYLRTKNVTEMAKALGHATYKSTLLRRYLPDAILSFFQTRWIRIFQRSIICEAMKDSPYLLDATCFESMDELHSFLKNHALKDIPHHLRNPENRPDDEKATSQKGHVYISIDVGIMTALLSLEAAVRASDRKQQICGRARYWAEVSKTVSKEIERGHDSLLKEHLSVAKSHCNPSQMEKVIYATAA
jgi:hypothetical protein